MEQTVKLTQKLHDFFNLTSQEGPGGRLNLGAGKRDLGPALINVKPTRILEETVEESATSIALEKLD